MKSLRLALVASSLVLAISINAFAGDMNCGFIPPPPQTQSVSGGETQSASAGNIGIANQNTTSAGVNTSYTQLLEVYGRALMASLDFVF